MKAADLYETDFAEWAQRNADLLRSGRVLEADLEHIAEEIEDLAKRERRKSLGRLLKENPSFRPDLASVITEAYEEAADLAALVLGRPRRHFPEVCPYSLEQLLDENFLP